MNSKKPAIPNKRHQSRAYAMQVIFQSHFSDEAIDTLLQEFLIDHLREEKNIDLDYFRILVLGTLKNIESLDKSMTPFLDRAITQLNPVELAVLRLAVFELTHQKEVPPVVVINEAINLTKEFGSQDGYKFVNGVLNAMVKNNK
ncbi:MAG TPA: transcription antitermination factor NusB [Coxiellaceae bacterium]|nr:MAG: transcription antitermination factor NusB [Gammaproteobacteria bacterium RIFCSPHIGHO2_12_FULL_36_30]HLB56589.1 transcription antitermination factor NusB [Coxiellaceae bacterium]